MSQWQTSYQHAHKQPTGHPGVRMRASEQPWSHVQHRTNDVISSHAAYPDPGETWKNRWGQGAPGQSGAQRRAQSAGPGGGMRGYNQAHGDHDDPGSPGGHQYRRPHPRISRGLTGSPPGYGSPGYGVAAGGGGYDGGFYGPPLMGHGAHPGAYHGGPPAPTTRDLPMEQKPPVKVDMAHMVVKKFRECICHRQGPNGINKFSKCFMLVDKNRDGKVGFKELQRALNLYGLHMPDKDAHMLMSAIDKDGSGNISENEFLAGLQGNVPKGRMKLIMQVFDKLDFSKNGSLEPADIASFYHIPWDPDVKSGNVPAHMPDPMTNFFKHFDTIDTDGVITKAEFVKYYKNLSSGIDNDDYFELMIRNAWHIPGGNGSAANTSNMRVEVQLSDGTQKVVCLQDDIGLRRGDERAVRAELEKEGVANIASISFK